ncbi:hypothetical protein RF11_05261 [Thelohanellus kitauei]|uniref:Uncharacterized protein n=1 Tax=Thelohanellus kitauei TaxID=669202 RepID=A0A0C2NAM8_THEKT|nr:hypothetical protein RF11_05261 [Thelohanellus kitauei]
MKSHQENTEVLIRTQKQPFSEIIESMASMFSRVVSVPVVESFDSSKEKFASCSSRLEQHFSSCAVVLVDDKKAKFPDLDRGVEFSRCVLKSDQSYKHWVAELRSIAKMCRFQCSSEGCGCSLIDEDIRDAIILRTPHRYIQGVLIHQKNPSLEQVLSVAESPIVTIKTVDAIKHDDDKVVLNKNDDRKTEKSIKI